MAARIVTLADAITTEINAGTFTPTVTAVRRNFVRDELESSSSLVCDVTPGGVMVDEGTRSQSEKRYTVHVTLRQKLVGDTDVKTGVMLQLAEEIENHLARKDMAGMGFIDYGSASGARDVFDRDLMIEYRMFFVQLDLTYLEFV